MASFEGVRRVCEECCCSAAASFPASRVLRAHCASAKKSPSFGQKSKHPWLTRGGVSHLRGTPSLSRNDLPINLPALLPVRCLECIVSRYVLTPASSVPASSILRAANSVAMVCSTVDQRVCQRVVATVFVVCACLGLCGRDKHLKSHACQMGHTFVPTASVCDQSQVHHLPDRRLLHVCGVS